MPRLTNAVPKYRKHRASGKAVVTIAGQDHYLGPHGTKASKAAYDRLVAEYLAGGRRPAAERSAPEVFTVTELIAAYWTHAQSYYRKGGKPTTELALIKTALRKLRSFYGTLPAAEFGPLKLKAVRAHWVEAGHARRSINNNVGRICRAFRWAVSEELIEPAVYDALKSVAGLAAGRSDAKESTPVPPIALEVVERTIPHLSAVVADMVRLQLATGARPAEVCKLRPGDLDRSGDVWEYAVGGHKTEHHGRKRTVYIGPEGQAILGPYLLRGPAVPCFSPAEAAEQSRAAKHARRITPLSCGNRPGSNVKSKPRRQAGDQYVTAAYGRAIARACDAAFPAPAGTTGDDLKAWQKLNRWAPNQLRHTTATAIRKRFGLEAAQVILGHAAASVTEIYAERDAEKARDVARQVG